jgi:hypothetical protein
LGEVPAVAVLYTNNPEAGEVTGVVELVAVKATLGGKKPLVVLVTSSCAEEFGVLVPIPTCENEKVGTQKSISKSLRPLIIK